MKCRALPLYGKLSLVLLSVTTLSSAAIVALGAWSNNQYHQEVTQRLNAGLAAYIIAHLKKPLINDNGAVRQASLKSIAMHTMMINPLVEVYLLDTTGKILGHALHSNDVVRTHVDLKPVHRFLAGHRFGPLVGDDPRNVNRQKIFSAAPVPNNGSTQGYLYVVLSSSSEQSIAAQLSGSYIVKVSVSAVLLLLGGMVLSLLLSFRKITRPLQRLTQQAQTFQNDLAPETGSNDPQTPVTSELQALEGAFIAMRERIKLQLDEIKKNEKLRRELISNISHDLRTPLASIQGYVETLILKNDQLNAEKQQQYLNIALKHCRKLNKLVVELFELSKLETIDSIAKAEIFSLAELAYDIVQEYQLEAQQRHVTLKIDHDHCNPAIKGDLSLIERVFQNLIDNALKHTPTGGEISIRLLTKTDCVLVQVIDTGVGIAAAELPFIFDRYYRSTNVPAPTTEAGTGLGLAIVKRILELHGSTIEVQSSPDQGARFLFPLPLATEHA